MIEKLKSTYANYGGFWIIAIFSTLCFAVSLQYFKLYGYTPAAFGSIGATYQTYLNHRYFTFFTAMFVHTSWGHLISNMMMLGFTSYVLVDLFRNKPIFLPVYYIVVNVFAIGLSSLFYRNDVIAGGSGAVSALLTIALASSATYFVYACQDKEKKDQLKYGLQSVISLILLLALVIPTGGDTAAITHWFGAGFGILTVIILQRIESRA